MSAAAIYDHLLKVQHLGYATFDSEFTLLEHNFQHSEFRQSSELSPGRTSIWQTFPELVGSESVLAEMLAGKRKLFVLEKLNQPDRSGKLRYFNLQISILPGGPGAGARLLFLAEDVTAQTALEQEVRQRQYNVRMLQARLLNQSQFLSDALLGESEKIRGVRDFVVKVAQYNTSVLLQGESGTGKSLVARLIHRAGSEHAGPFVEINCAAIPETLLESELFGHEKGAFTNALTSRKGLLEEADGGTLFLDEIGELPLSMQAKLLNFLEMRRFRRLGSTKEQSVKVRVVAATNKDLRQAVAEKAFREDLYFRINVVAFTLPAMRELGQDIVSLAGHFIEILQIDMKKKVRLSEDAKRKLLAYGWPGNVRELRNVIERAMIFASGEWLHANDLLLQQTAPGLESSENKPVVLPESGLSLEDLERQYLLESLRKTKGNQSRSAELLAMSLDTFRYRLKKHGISAKSFR